MKTNKLSVVIRPSSDEANYYCNTLKCIRYKEGGQFYLFQHESGYGDQTITITHSQAVQLMEFLQKATNQSSDLEWDTK